MVRDKRTAQVLAYVWIIVGMACFAVTAWIWWAASDLPPNQTDARILLAPPTLGAILVGVGLWTLITGRRVGAGSPRWPYISGNRNSRQTDEDGAER